MEQEIKNLEEQFLKELPTVTTATDVETLRVKYLGRNSHLSELFSRIPSLSKEEKGIVGKQLNIVKQKITALIEEKNQGIGSCEETVDLTYPPRDLKSGSQHILSTVSQKICSIFENLGFNIAEGGEIEDEWHNFSALNIPLDHPSRDAFDTFYLNIPQTLKGKYLLRSHTSPSQVRIMENCRPPLAVISPGRVYRPDAMDASHSFMFHQIEGFVVDKDINFSHLKGVLLHFTRQFFSPDVELRFRPHFFPFTEPSAEVDVSCIICKPQGQKAGKASSQSTGIKEKCSVCKGKGWLEILGCGMIHPNVLENCGIDSKKYSGFAFGMGVERITMLKYRVNDIRLFYENDVRFLEQF